MYPPSSTDTGLSPLGRCCEQLVPHAGPDARGRCRPRAPKPGVCAVWVHSGRGIPGPPTQGSPSCKSSKQAPPPRGREGVSGGPPAQQPRLKPGVWEAPCPVCLCHLCLENPCGPFECSKKAREFNVLQEHNCIFIAHYISS